MDGLDQDLGPPKAILKAAFGVFVQYGYRRTSMEDIAGAAKMSRPALYQHFSNKKDIYRSLVQAHFADKVAAITRGLAQDRDPVSDLQAGFEGLLGPVTEVLLTAPHGADLLDASEAVGADAVAEGTRAVQDAFHDWLVRGQGAGRIDPMFDSLVMAWTITQAAYGVKQAPYARYRAALMMLAQVLGRGMAPDRTAR